MTGPVFDRDFAVEYGRVDRLSRGVRRVVADNPNRFTFTGTGTYLVGTGDVAVIDPGPALAGHADAILAALGPGERISHMVVTHTHSDHSPGCSLLRERGVDAPTFGFGPHGPVAPDDPSDRVVFGDPDADERDDKPGELREGADTAFRPDVPVIDGSILKGSGWTLQAVYTPGHTSNHVCWAFPEEGVLFTGDHIMGWSTTVIGPPDGSLNEYLSSLDVLLRRHDRRYWPTHGPHIDNPHTLVRAIAAHRAERTAQLLAQLAQGPRTLAEMVPTLYAGVDKKLWPAAAASMYAHLLALTERGRVTVVGEPRRTSVYSLA